MGFFTGTAGDDDFTGTFQNDTFDLTHGGDDAAKGKSGNDNFDLGAAFNAGDSLDGGTGHDSLILGGDYSAGLTITAAMLLNCEAVSLLSGYSYDLTFRDGVNSGLFGFSIFGLGLGAGQVLRFDGSQETSNSFSIYGGGGNDRLIGGEAADQFYLFYAGGGDDIASGRGGNDTFVVGDTWTKHDKIDGGTGRDAMTLAEPVAIHLRANSMANVEQFFMADGASYKIILHDANVAAQGRLSADAFLLTGTNRLTFNGGAETDGLLSLGGGASKDALTGGGGHDDLTGRGGADTLVGGDGDDLVNGGGGHDVLTGGGGQDTFAFGEGESPFGNPDRINDLALSDVIDLALIDADVGLLGDQGFTLVGAFTGIAGQLTLDYDSGTNTTSVLMDTDGDSAADQIIFATGNRTGFTNFVL